MNKFNKDKTYKKIFQAKKIKISPLTMSVKTKKLIFKITKKLIQYFCN